MNNETEKDKQWSTWRDLFRGIGEAGAVAGVPDPDPDSNGPEALNRILYNDLDPRTAHEAPSPSAKETPVRLSLKSSNPEMNPCRCRASGDEEESDLGHYENAA